MNPCLPFAGNLLQNSFRNNGFSKNIVLSPLSLNAIAAMLAAGCSGRSLKRVLSFVGCDDLEQLKSMFSRMMSIATSSSSPSSSACSGMSNSCSGYRGGGGSSPPKISFVNGVWVDTRFPLKPSYRDCVINVFKSDAKNVDFQEADKAIKEINSWAELQTNGLIKDVIQRGHISPDAALILGNALYFKGYWADKFDTTRTLNQNFSLLGGDKVSVPFMCNSGYYLYGSFDDFKVIKLPYNSGNIGDKRFSMQFILPHKIEGLQDLVLKFNSGFINQHFELERTHVNAVRIPKIKFSSVLGGIRFPFMEEHMDLTEMIHARDPSFISKVIHKAFIEVDEKGTEAAAVTFSEIMGCSPCRARQREIKTFVADHPFMFIVKEETSGLVLFAGAVVNPLLE